jgi:hypothetical protein
MDGTDVTSAVEAAHGTRLDRLGSQQSLLALTNAQLDRETVLLRTGSAELVARETFSMWVDSGEEIEAARETFRSVAETEADHAERVLKDVDADPDPTAGALHEHLRDLEGTVDRIGAGLIGRPLVADRTTLQVINFFINEADEARATLFRELRTDTRAMRAEGEGLLDALCAGDTEYERARDAAVGAVEIAYEEYAAALEGMGFDPRPVC